MYKTHISERPLNIREKNLIQSNKIKQYEYNLKPNNIDPIQSSPPNGFMINLYMRDNLYNNNANNQQ